MTREEKLYSMRMVDLKVVADKLGIKINIKAAKSKAVETILAAEEMNKQNEKEIAKEEKQIKKIIEESKLVPMPGTEGNWGENHWGNQDGEVTEIIEELAIECPEISQEELDEIKQASEMFAEADKEIVKQAKKKTEAINVPKKRSSAKQISGAFSDSELEEINSDILTFSTRKNCKDICIYHSKKLIAVLYNGARSKTLYFDSENIASVLDTQDSKERFKYFGHISSIQQFKSVLATLEKEVV